MNFVTEVLHCAVPVIPQNYRSLVIRDLSLRLGVHSHQVQVLPNGLQKLVEIPAEFTSDRHIVGNSVPDLEFLQTDFVNHVQNVNTWTVDSVVFNRVDQIVRASVAGKSNICVD